MYLGQAERRRKMGDIKLKDAFGFAIGTILLAILLTFFIFPIATACVLIDVIKEFYQGKQPRILGFN